MKTIDEILEKYGSHSRLSQHTVDALYRYEDEARARILELELRLDLLEKNTKI